MHRFALIWIVLLLLCGGCRQDSATWKFAEGLNEYEAGNLEPAIELLQESLKLDPDATSIKLTLARMLAENCQGDLGLAWCDEVLEQFPENLQARTVRTLCLQYLGRFEDAFREYQKVVAGEIDKPEEQLNNLAYFRALADQELDKATRQINQAIGHYERSTFWGNLKGVPIHVQAIVSVGLLSRQVGGREFVVESMNDLIVQHEDQWLADNAKLDGLLRIQELNEKTNQEAAAVFQTSIDLISNQIQNIEGSLALLLATRCLMSEDAGEVARADHDLLWLKKIGYEPQDVFDRLPGDFECWSAVQVSTMYLDTRGFVLTKLPWPLQWIDPMGQVVALPIGASQLSVKRGSYADALFDLDVAIAAAEINQLAFNSPLANRLRSGFGQPRSPTEIFAKLGAEQRFRKQQASKLIAVLRYHRLNAHEKAGLFEQASLDRQRIESLGFEADGSLF